MKINIDVIWTPIDIVNVYNLQERQEGGGRLKVSNSNKIDWMHESLGTFAVINFFYIQHNNTHTHTHRKNVIHSLQYIHASFTHCLNHPPFQLCHIYTHGKYVCKLIILFANFNSFFLVSHSTRFCFHYRSLIFFCNHNENVFSRFYYSIWH